MKTSFSVFPLVLIAFAGCKCGDVSRSVVGTITETTVETVKGAASGISSGIEEGRKQTRGPDGALVLTTFADTQGKLGFEILSVVADDTEGTATITLGLVNQTGDLLRLSGLGPSSVMVLDQGGYITRSQGGPSEITVPARAKDKAVFKFKGQATSFTTLRVLGGDISLSK